MSGDVGKILEVAAVAAAAYFTAGGSLAASGGAAAGGIGSAAAAGYGSAAEIGAAGDAFAASDAGMIGSAAAYGGAASAGATALDAGAFGAGDAALGTGGAALTDTIPAGSIASTLGDASPSLIGTPTFGGYSPQIQALAGSQATAPAAAITPSPLTSALDWLSKNKSTSLGVAKLLAGSYMLSGPSAQQNAILNQMAQNSQNLQPIPASQANLTDAQLQAIERSMAAGGYLGSGNMMAAIAKGALGQQLQVGQYNNSVAAQKQALLSQQLMNSGTSAATTLSGLGLLAGGAGELLGWK